MSSRLFVAIPGSIPGVVLALAVGGQAKEQLAVAALVGGAILPLWTLGLILGLVIQVVRKASWVPILAGLALSAVAFITVLTLVLHAPLWVQWRAAPAIRAIEQLRAENGAYPDVGSLEGDFPTQLRATLSESGHCIYKPREGSYHLACLGLPYGRCGYDGATQSWSGWE